jgi:hypothetical protein
MCVESQKLRKVLRKIKLFECIKLYEFFVDFLKVSRISLLKMTYFEMRTTSTGSSFFELKPFTLKISG